jgi:hypothetical protein
MNDKEKHKQKKADAEDKAMKWLNKRINTTYQREPAIHCVYDGILTSGNTEYLIEVKVREDYTNEAIQSYGGSFLELKKIVGIINHQNDNRDYRKILYIVFLKDCVNIYDIYPDPNEFKWELKNLPRNNFDKSLEWKMITKLKDEDKILTIKY